VDVTLFFAPTSGGVRRYLLAKHVHLARRGRLRHTILVPGKSDTGLPDDVVTFGSPAIPFGRGYRAPLALARFRSQLRALAPDLIEVGDPYQLAWQSLRVARELQRPSIAFCHSDVESLARAALGAWTARQVRRYLARLYGQFDLVLAPSAHLAQRLRDAGIRPVEIQPLGVDVDVFRPDAADPGLRASLGIPGDARLLVFAGRLSPEKRIPVLRAAMRRLGPGYHLLLVGSGRRTRPAPNVTLVNYQQDPGQLARLLASADAFVHAGDQETFGLVALEALACGLPVIASHAGALPELVDGTVGATFPPGDAAALAAAVASVFERDALPMRIAARRRAEAHGWQAVCADLLLRYERLLCIRERAAWGLRRAG
jgi:alpha-1,6-mannosyltransferase